MIQTILTIVLSTGLGIGSTLLVQTVILTPPAVVAVACPDPETTAVERALIDQALTPLPVDDYVPQGRPLRMPSMFGGK